MAIQGFDPEWVVTNEVRNLDDIEDFNRDLFRIAFGSESTDFRSASNLVFDKTSTQEKMLLDLRGKVMRAVESVLHPDSTKAEPVEEKKFEARKVTVTSGVRAVEDLSASTANAVNEIYKAFGYTSRELDGFKRSLEQVIITTEPFVSRMKQKQPMTREERDILEKVGNKLLQAIEDEQIVLSVDAPIMVPVKYPDASFRQKTVYGGWHMFPDYFYVGESGQPIFGLIPERADARYSEGIDWASAEFNLKKFDEAFPLVAVKLAEIMNLSIKDESMLSVFNALRAQETVQRDINREQTEEKLKANPLFGMF